MSLSGITGCRYLNHRVRQRGDYLKFTHEEFGIGQIISSHDYDLFPALERHGLCGWFLLGGASRDATGAVFKIPREGIT